MASPSPMAVARFSEKIDTGVTAAMTRRAKNVPITVMIPRASGREAATALPNTRISSTRVMGKAMASAFLRSDSIWVPTCRNTSAKPPTPTVTTAS